MNNSSAEQALIQIEQNLTKLDAARKQVLDVTSHGKEISTIMIELVKKIQQVYDLISLESASFIQGYQTNQKKLDQNTEKLLQKSGESTGLFLSQIDGYSQQFSESVFKVIKANTAQSATFLKKQQNEFDSHLKVLSDFSKALETFKKSFVDTGLAKSSELSELKTLIKKTADDIVADIDFSENVHIKNHNETAESLKNFQQESLALNKLNYDQLSQQNATGFNALTLAFKESQDESAGFAAQLENLHLEQHTSLLEKIEHLSQQNEKLQKENHELLKVLVNKKVVNTDNYFYITWLLLFFGLILSVYLLKRF